MLDQWETDANSEFTIPMELRGGGGPFEVVDVVEPVPSGDDVSIVLPTAADRLYEWYVEVTDCVHTAASKVGIFTTNP